ncbi:MAG TPA: hypothetical protein VLG69_00765 [Candidatus Andersenbacteria bacterium]|nr:hypothetical protein [Candidatus Andersenbacteria bacterium]
MTKSALIWIVIIIIVLVAAGVWAMNSANKQPTNSPASGVGNYPVDTTMPAENTSLPAVTPDQNSATQGY